LVRRQYRHRLCEQAVYLYPCRRCSSRLFLHPLPRPTPTTRPFSFSTAPTNSFPNPLADVRVRSESEWRPDANAEENNSCATFSACSTTTRTHAGPFRINQRPLDLWCTGSCGVFNIAPGHGVEWGGCLVVGLPLLLDRCFRPALCVSPFKVVPSDMSSALTTSRSSMGWGCEDEGG